MGSRWSTSRQDASRRCSPAARTRNSSTSVSTANRFASPTRDAGVATIVDLDSGEILHEVSVGEEPEGVRTSPDGKYYYVTGETDHNITVIDATTGEAVTQITVGHRPRDANFSSDSTRAYVTSEIDGTVSVIDVAAHEVINTIALPEGSRTMGVLVSPDDRRLYVSNGRSKTVSVIDVATCEVTGSVEVGPRPWGIGLSADGKRLYTATPSGLSAASHLSQKKAASAVS